MKGIVKMFSKRQYRCPRSGNLSRCSMNYTGKPVYETHPVGV